MVCDGYAYKSVGAEAAGDANIYVNMTYTYDVLEYDVHLMYWSTPVRSVIVWYMVQYF